MQIFGFLGSFLGYILWGIFYIFKNFGLSVILFTLIIKLALFPFSVKQQKSMAGNARMAKKQKELQEKYGNNRQKYSEELNKLYEKEGVKPMGGCLTSFVPIIVIFGIFYAVAYPLTNTLHISSEDVNSALAYVNTIPGYASSANPTYQEISLLNIFPNIVNTEAIQGIFDASEISTIQTFVSGFNWGGVNLFAVPKDYGFFSPYILFPALCLVSNLAAQFVMTKVNKTQMQQQQGCMKVMLYVMPLISAYFAYAVPSAVGLYWIISSVVSLVQSVITGKLFSPDQLTAKSEARHAALLFENESKIKYVYAPKSEPVSTNVNKKKKK